MKLKRFAAATVSGLLLASVGCHVNTHKNGDGNDDVDIGTPFGSVQVKSENSAAQAQTGLTPYPGAVLVKKGNDDHGAADISLNFGNFKLGVHTADLQTADSPDKVLAFYRRDMARYGTVLTCHGKTAVGTPVRTEDGLTCGSNEHGHDGNADHLELRAGSERHQHIVAVHPEDGSTRIGLVALDLPGSEPHHDDNDRE